MGRSDNANENEGDSQPCSGAAVSANGTPKRRRAPPPKGGFDSSNDQAANGVAHHDASGASNGKVKPSVNGDCKSENNGVPQSNGNGKKVGSGAKGRKEETGGGWSGCLHRTLAPLALMVFTPNFVILLWYTAARCDGSFLELFERLTRHGVYEGVKSIWLDIHIASPLAVTVLLCYIAWALALMVVVPGPRVEGPVTPNGNTPVYRDNGFSCFLITMGAFGVLAWALRQYTEYSVTIVYDRFDEFLGTLTVFTHGLCIMLHLKGLVMPSSSDSGTTGNLVFDYFWGTELYPRILGIDIKVFTNCRFGMTVWPLLVAIFTLKNYELNGFVDGAWVSFVLFYVYFVKFFWWESGYMRTIDIMLDRAGYYICWGCLCWIQGVYASVSMYLATHATPLGTWLSLTILILGVTSCIINYLADEQKLEVRRTAGKCLVWGRPPEVIKASYALSTGEERTSLLLVSGYWGITRHFHYVPELALAFLWTAPALANHLMPYTYAIHLVILLVHRTFRDDVKCRQKYGKAWDEYCRRVPYKMIPYVF